MDDDPEIRRLVLAMLNRLGYEATAVADGTSVVTEYRRQLHSTSAYDIVILDLTIPGGMGGCEAMAQLLRVDPDVRAVVSSGYSNDEVMADFRKYGFSGMVVKPYQTASLANALSQLVSRAEV
jgi:CheY-like chemotaxis protein